MMATEDCAYCKRTCVRFIRDYPRNDEDLQVLREEHAPGCKAVAEAEQRLARLQRMPANMGYTLAIERGGESPLIRITRDRTLTFCGFPRGLVERVGMDAVLRVVNEWVLPLRGLADLSWFDGLAVNVPLEILVERWPWLRS